MQGQRKRAREGSTSEEIGTKWSGVLVETATRPRLASARARGSRSCGVCQRNASLGANHSTQGRGPFSGLL